MNIPKVGQIWGLGYDSNDPNTWYYHVIYADENLIRLQFISTSEEGVYAFHRPGEIVQHKPNSFTKKYSINAWKWFCVDGT